MQADPLLTSMHEYSLVQALLQRVEQEARARHASAVHGVVVCIGPLAGVDPALFSSAYEICRVGTLCQSAALTITGDQVAWQCESCARPIPAGAPLRCPACGGPARLTGGDALVLERIELEVPEDSDGLWHSQRSGPERDL